MGGLVLVLATAGCDSIPAPGGLPGWNVGQTQQVGVCEVQLRRLGYYHSTSWNMEVEVEMRNLSDDDQRCAWSAQLVSATKKPMTESVGEGRTMTPGEVADIQRLAREKDLTGFSGRPSEGDWVLLVVTQGQPVIGDESKFHATPERLRPPN